MTAKCVICGKTVSKSVSSAGHPEKHVCLNCLNGLVFNVSTVSEALEPITKAFSKAFNEVKDDIKE
jgi:hypothetical protein